LDFCKHTNIGPNDDAVICPSRSYGLPCPICEDARDQSRGDITDEDRKALPWAKRQCLYNIYCYDKDAGEDMYLFDISHFVFQSELDSLAHNARTGEDINFAWIERGELLGHSIQFERKGTGKDNTRFFGHKFLPRDYDLTQKDIDKALSLDQVINVLSYDDLHDMYFGKKSDRKQQDDERQEEVKGERASESRSRTRPSSGDGIGDNPCPYGYEFGVDIGSKKECEKICQAWEECLKEEKELRLGAKDERKEEPPAETSAARRGRREPEKEEQPQSRRRLNRG